MTDREDHFDCGGPGGNYWTDDREPTKFTYGVGVPDDSPWASTGNKTTPPFSEDVHRPRRQKQWVEDIMAKWDAKIAREEADKKTRPKMVSIEFDHIPPLTWTTLTNQPQEEPMQDICQPDHEKPTDPGIKYADEITEEGPMASIKNANIKVDISGFQHVYQTTESDEELRLLGLAVAALDRIRDVGGKEAGERVAVYLAGRYMLPDDD